MCVCCTYRGLAIHMLYRFRAMDVPTRSMVKRCGCLRNYQRAPSRARPQKEAGCFQELQGGREGSSKLGLVIGQLSLESPGETEG